MNLAEAWEAGNGIAFYRYHNMMDIIISFVDDDHVDIKFGTKESGYSHIPKSPVFEFGGWLKDLGIRPQDGWEPGKEENRCLNVTKVHQIPTRHNQRKKPSKRSLRRH